MNIDFMILDFIQKHMRCEMLDAVMPVITALGNGGIIWIAMTAILLCFPKTRRLGAGMAVSLALEAVLCNVILKPLAARTRPFDIRTEIVLLIARPHDYSFPSGHTLAAFTAASVIFCVNRRAGAAAFLFAALMGFSRLYLFVHYTTDILAGAALGCLVGFLTVFIFYKTGNWPARESRAEGQKPHGG